MLLCFLCLPHFPTACSGWSCSSQVMPNPDTPRLKVLQKWKLLKLNESSTGLITAFCAYVIKFFHGKKFKKKKKKGPDPLKAFHLKSPSLTTMQSLGHVNPLPLCSHLLLLLGSHITCCQRSFHLRASARAVSSALNTPSLDTCLVSHFSGFAEMPFSGKLPWPTLPLSKLLSLPFPNSLLLPLLYFSLCLITI